LQHLAPRTTPGVATDHEATHTPASLPSGTLPNQVAPLCAPPYLVAILCDFPTLAVPPHGQAGDRFCARGHSAGDDLDVLVVEGEDGLVLGQGQLDAGDLRVGVGDQVAGLFVLFGPVDGDFVLDFVFLGNLGDK
jgi:hypothetical protein